MRLRAVRVLPLRLRHPWRLSRGSWTHKHNLVVELEEDGVVGRGESAPNVRYGESTETVRQVAPGLAARLDGPADEHAAHARTLAALIPGHPAAKAAVELAVLDLAARRRGVGLPELLGLERRPTPPTSFTLGITTREELDEKLALAAPWPHLKLKLGGPDDHTFVKAVRARTGKPIRVDANEGWPDAAHALRELAFLADHGIDLVEQPLPARDVGGLARLAAESPLPLALDESVTAPGDVDALAAAGLGKVTTVNVKLQKLGGLHATRAVIARARAHGLRVLLGCMIESSLGIAAATALAAEVDEVDLDGHLLLADDPAGPIAVTGAGGLVPPRGPGVGVSPRYPRA